MTSPEPRVARLVHEGRGIVTHEVHGEQVTGWPETAYESIRAINHLTGSGVIPAPVLYRVVGELKGVGHLLPQALEQLGAGLERSLHEYDVTDTSGRTPTETVRQARALLAEAAGQAAELGRLLESVQSLIAEQGYNDPSNA